MSQVLADLFFSRASARILDFLTDEYSNNPVKDHSRYEIQDKAGVTLRSMNRWLPILKKVGFIEITRYVSRAEMVRLASNPITEALIKFRESLMFIQTKID